MLCCTHFPLLFYLALILLNITSLTLTLTHSYLCPTLWLWSPPLHETAMVQLTVAQPPSLQSHDTGTSTYTPVVRHRDLHHTAKSSPHNLHHSNRTTRSQPHCTKNAPALHSNSVWTATFTSSHPTRVSPSIFVPIFYYLFIIWLINDGSKTIVINY